jgi:hypothetical protein
VVEDEFALGRVVVEDFTRARVLDRLLLYERRIESSLYRTMAELRKKQEARQASAARAVRGEGSRSEGRLQAGQEAVTPAELASFGANAAAGTQMPKIAFGSPEPPAGFARGPGRRSVGGNHGQACPERSQRDAHTKETPDGVTTNPAAHHSSIPLFQHSSPVLAMPVEGQSCETKPIGGGTRPGERALAGEL